MLHLITGTPNSFFNYSPILISPIVAVLDLFIKSFKEFYILTNIRESLHVILIQKIMTTKLNKKLFMNYRQEKIIIPSSLYDKIGVKYENTKIYI